MSQTILIESNEKLCDLYTINLQAHTGTDVIHRRSAAEAVELLTILPTVSLIIMRNRIEDEKTVDIVMDYLDTHELDIPVIITDKNDQYSKRAITLEKASDWRSLVSHSAKCLGVTPKDLEEMIRPDFIPMPIGYFFHLKESPCDVYIRIKKDGHEAQFLKRIHAQDSVDNDRVKEYKEQGVKNLYVPKEFQENFVNVMTNALVLKLESDDLGEEERVIATSEAFDIVSNQIQTMGLDESAIQLASASINSMMKSVQESPKLGKLLKTMMDNKIGYAYRNVHLTTLICHHILNKMKWSSDNQKQTISFLAFFHDITLDKEEMLKIRTQEQLDKSSLSDEEKTKVLRHASDIARIIAELPEAPYGLDVLIQQHHGVEDGLGFNTNWSNTLSPLAIIFIVAEEFAFYILNPEPGMKIKDIVGKLKYKFTKPAYQDAIACLESTIQKKTN